MKTTAIIVAAGRGNRMNSDIPKQYIEINGHAILYYTIRAFEESFIDDIVLVVPEGDEEYCRQQFQTKYNFKKIKAIVAGGKNRYDSVYAGLKSVVECDYVFIHDGARPFIKNATIKAALDAVQIHKACVVAVPVKDTIKIADEEGFVASTPNRSTMWSVQTPQVFDYNLIKAAYDSLLANDLTSEDIATITDDAMVVERATGIKVKLVTGEYDNIKITTPEDLSLAKERLK